MSKDLSKMIQYYRDADPELRDVLVMLVRQVEQQSAQIERLEKQMKRVNESMPSTAIKA